MGASVLKKNVVAVCGLKNSGKTMLIEGVVRHLTAKGLRVAVIKHDGHDFTCDVPGTDSAAFTAAGAYGVAVFSKERIFVHKTGCGEDETYLQSLFPEADLILIEGCKDSAYKKIEVIRRGISDTPVSNPDGRFLIATDHPEGYFKEETLPRSDASRIADAVWRKVRENT